MKLHIRMAKIYLGMLLLGVLALGGCATRAGGPPAFTATGTATFNPTLPPSEARPEANSRAENQARDQIMSQAGQMAIGNGQNLEDVAAIDSTVRGEMMDTVRGAHITARSISPEGVITINLNLDKSEVQEIIDRYRQRSGK